MQAHAPILSSSDSQLFADAFAVSTKASFSSLNFRGMQHFRTLPPHQKIDATADLADAVAISPRRLMPLAMEESPPTTPRVAADFGARCSEASTPRFRRELRCGQAADAEMQEMQIPLTLRDGVAAKHDLPPAGKPPPFFPRGRVRSRRSYRPSVTKSRHRHDAESPRQARTNDADAAEGSRRLHDGQER